VSIDTVDQLKDLMNKSGVDSATIEKIMDKFVVKDKNTVLRTNLEDVPKMTALMVIYFDLKQKKLKDSANTLKEYIDRYIENRVSKDGMSWKYIFDAISAIKRENNGNNLMAKLTGQQDKEGK